MKIWGRKDAKTRLDNIIFETNLQPFGVSAYNPNEKVSDFVNRGEELAILKDQTQLVWHHKMSRAIRLEGPAGVGKSTLFNFLKESIEAERVDEQGAAKYLSKNTDIFSTYLQVPDQIQDFGDIWKPMLIGLVPGFSEETDADIGLPEYVALHLIYRMFQEDPQPFLSIIWPEKKPSTPVKYIEFKDIIYQVKDGGTKTVEQIQEYYRLNKRKLREKFKTEVNNVQYEIRRADTQVILNLFRVLDEDDPEDYLELIRNVDSTIFSSNDELVRYFNDLMRFYACSTNKQPLLLLGIDEVAKTDEEIGADYYRTLGNLFVRLRNSLNFVLFVFISTTDDWAKYDNIINKNSDLFNQIQDFMYRIMLKQLNISEMIMVFKNRMRRFWENQASDKPTRNPYYPFSSECFEYVYRYHMRDLRKSIKFLDKLWFRFRHYRKIPRLLDMFSTIRVVRSMTGKGFDPDDFNKFEWIIFEKSFNDHSRFKSNSARSSAIEKGIETAWRCLQQEPGSAITKVENNPIITTSSGKRKPDIYLELHGNLGAEYRRRIEFQIKAYQIGSKVELKHLKSSLELFEENYTDFIYFIITGDGLKSNAEYQVQQLEDKYPNRIRRPILNNFQQQNLSFMALFDEITGYPLGKKPEIDVLIAKKVLANILAQQVEKFLVEIKNLSYRRLVTEKEQIEAILEPEVVTPIPTTPQEPIYVSGQSLSEPVLDSYLRDESSQIETPSTTEQLVQWLQKYSHLENYKYEACALCSYMQSRETGSSKHKFYPPTVEKNVIRKDATTSPEKYKKLIEYLFQNNYIEKDKRSYKWTNIGLEFYYAVKKENFQC